jgi:acyl-CoA hydrolase
MDWKQIYQDRTVEAREAVGMIQSRDEIFLGHAAAEPRYLVRKLLERKDELQGVRLVQGLNIGDAPYRGNIFCGQRKPGMPSGRTGRIASHAFLCPTPGDPGGKGGM